MHLHFPFGLLKPACLSTLLSVPGARSSPGWPAIVTRPGFRPCLNWRWLPLVATKNQPSCSISSMTSRIFIGEAMALGHGDSNTVHLGWADRPGASSGTPNGLEMSRLAGEGRAAWADTRYPGSVPSAQD